MDEKTYFDVLRMVHQLLPNKIQNEENHYITWKCDSYITVCEHRQNDGRFKNIKKNFPPNTGTNNLETCWAISSLRDYPYTNLTSTYCTWWSNRVTVVLDCRWNCKLLEASVTGHSPLLFSSTFLILFGSLKMVLQYVINRSKVSRLFSSSFLSL